MDSISYRIDSDQRPLSTLVVLYPVEQFEDGLLVYTDSKPCLRVPNESDPGSIYIESDSVGEDDQRYIPEDWLSPDMCQAITSRFPVRRQRMQKLTDGFQILYSNFAI